MINYFINSFNNLRLISFIYTYIKTQINMNMEDMNKEQLIKKIKELDDIKTKYNKDKSRCKKWYSNYYMKDEASLTDEEKKTQEERIKKRREYMNARYQTIYKPKKQQLKAQLTT